MLESKHNVASVDRGCNQVEGRAVAFWNPYTDCITGLNFVWHMHSHAGTFPFGMIWRLVKMLSWWHLGTIAATWMLLHLLILLHILIWIYPFPTTIHGTAPSSDHLETWVSPEIERSIVMLLYTNIYGTYMERNQIAIFLIFCCFENQYSGTSWNKEYSITTYGTCKKRNQIQITTFWFKKKIIWAIWDKVHTFVHYHHQKATMNRDEGQYWSLKLCV